MIRNFNGSRFPRGGGDGFDGLHDFFSGFGNSIFPWGGIVMLFLGLVIVGLLIYLVVKGNKTTASAAPSVPGEPVKDTDYFVRLLKESYAKGQISDEEFERKVRILRENE